MEFRRVRLVTGEFPRDAWVTVRLYRDAPWQLEEMADLRPSGGTLEKFFQPCIDWLSQCTFDELAPAPEGWRLEVASESIRGRSAQLGAGHA